MNPLLKLIEHGQSYWLDGLTRGALRSGALARRVESEGLCGVRCNPKLLYEAVSAGSDYEQQIALVADAELGAAGIYQDLVVTDARDACDLLRPVYDRSGHRDGFVSLGVSPFLAHDSQGSISEARALWERVDRPNLLIEIPGTEDGLVALEELVVEGVNVNVGLLFSVARYVGAAEAYLRALERRRAAGKPLDRVHSTASFLVSRIDALVDQLLVQRLSAARSGEPQPEHLFGRAAIASARLAYQRFKEITASVRWAALGQKGALPQRLVWASTSPKNPKYDDTMYVEALVGRDTICTLSPRTIEAFAHHGAVAETLEQGTSAAAQLLQDLELLGIRLEAVAEQLENEGIQKAIESYALLLDVLERSAEEHRRRTRLPELEGTARALRRAVIEMTTQAGSGHPTSSLSCADLVTALFFHEMRWDPRDPLARNVDQFVLSKGHAAPILWAALLEAGALAEDPSTLRRTTSLLEGHPTAQNPWVRVATGSLGQGLSCAAGIALANKLDGIAARVYCLLGDGECSEGSVWEAAEFAALQRLTHLIAIVDVNALGQTGPTPQRGDLEAFARRFAAFGWRTITVDGHDMGAVLEALREAAKDGPTALIARTTKGKGVAFVEDEPGWHGKPLDRAQADRALERIVPPEVKAKVKPRRVEALERFRPPPATEPVDVDYQPGARVATRDAFGSALRKLGSRYPDLIVLDGDVQDSTRTHAFATAYPERFVECFIAEQNMTGVAVGLASCDKIACAATFACFLSRAHDFIRMASYSHPAHLIFCGSHAGVSVGEDGPSQMGLDDLAMFRAVLGSTVLYPSDAVSAERLTEQALQTRGIVYLRTTRPATPVLYASHEAFAVGGSKVLRAAVDDRLTIVGAGITVHEALGAYDLLREQGVVARVIDAYSVKPIDVSTLRAAAEETGVVLVVEDHAYEGGLGDAVADAVSGLALVERLAVRQVPPSGPAAELLEICGISRRAIAERARDVLRNAPTRPSGARQEAGGRFGEPRAAP